MCLLLAVLERRLGLKFSTHDVYINIAGGMRLLEPAADLAVAVALISAITDTVIPPDLIVFGELGLAGEVRAVPHAEYRIKEASRLGFRRIVLPKRAVSDAKGKGDAKLLGVGSIFEILPLLKREGKAET